jgi:hypothetical protein
MCPALSNRNNSFRQAMSLSWPLGARQSPSSQSSTESRLRPQVGWSASSLSIKPISGLKRRPCIVTTICSMAHTIRQIC